MALMFLSFGAILLTGSRAPIIAILFGYAALFFIAAFGKGMFSAKKKVLLLIFIVGISAAVLLPILAGKLEMFEKAMSIIERATNFSGISSGSDGSVLGRAQKIETGTAAVLDNSVIFGTGISSTPFVWVDNSFVRLLIDSGFGGLMLFAFIILGFVFNVFKTARANGNIRLFYVFFLACLTYFVNSVSTEFFLVTRSIFPFIILVCLIYKLISMPDLSKERAGP